MQPSGKFTTSGGSGDAAEGGRRQADDTADRLRPGPPGEAAQSHGKLRYRGWRGERRVVRQAR